MPVFASQIVIKIINICFINALCSLIVVQLFRGLTRCVDGCRTVDMQIFVLHVFKV
jgi:hypothetical protein